MLDSKILLEQHFTGLNYVTTADMATKIMNRRETATTALSPETMNAMIENKAAMTANILREVEDNFINSTKGHITFHEYLMKSAQKSGDMNGYMHHRVMMETYQTILSNYEASRRYGSGSV